MKNVYTEMIEHYLKIAGGGDLLPGRDYNIVERPDKFYLANFKTDSFHKSIPLVAIQPKTDFFYSIGIQEEVISHNKIVRARFFKQSDRKWIESYSQSGYKSYRLSKNAEPLVVDENGASVWLMIRQDGRNIIVIGTDLGSDLVRFRQGDPSAAENRPDTMMWGIAGERPSYLFTEQRANIDPYSRPADEWIYFLAETIARCSGCQPKSILPGNGLGAVVITGDDDQAELAKYDEQLAILGDLPITYFLHPKTKHSQNTLHAMQKMNRRVDFGIHPDALDEPDRYSEIFDEQVAWFKTLTGYSPLSVRNHGFLNDGYWGHLDSWLKHGVAISSNLPGFDGNIMNGSLLPARMFWKGQLTNHWSILTAIGDGIRFAGGLSDEQSADCIKSLADRMRADMTPGVIVLNLHPQNISETRMMHLAVRELVNSGFIAWNMKECLNWFENRQTLSVNFADRLRTFIGKLF